MVGKKNLKGLLYLIIVILLCSSCAKTSTPSGGPKDSIPPTLVNSIPTQKQLNYKKKNVQLFFSEDILLNNAKEQIIITPSINKEFKATAVKKTVLIEFEKELKDSTTYTINLRESVQDITEKNPAKNLQLAFSTSSYIDSLIISGHVFDILKGTDSKEVTVALIPNSDTLNIFKHKPLYVAKTDDKGAYKIENLKAAKYFVYAFDDKNKNLIVDSKNESYGFVPNPITLDSSLQKVEIPIQRLDARTLKLTSAKPYNNYFNIRTSKSLTTFEVSNSDIKFISSFGEDKANVRVYNTYPDQDSIKANFVASDSIGNKIDTTLYIKFTKKKSQTEKLSMDVSDIKINAKNGLLQSTITFNKPISHINFDSLLFQSDSANVFNITEKEIQWDFNNNILSIKKTIDPKVFIKSPPEKTVITQKTKPKTEIKNQLIIGKSTFISIDSDSSKKMSESPKILYEEETGTLLISIETNELNFITELLSKEYKVLESAKNSKSIVFSNLPPNAYQLRLIIDRNSNGKWDNGNFFKREKPEEIIFYKNEKAESTINLKANWELGPLLITY